MLLPRKYISLKRQWVPWTAFNSLYENYHPAIMFSWRGRGRRRKIVSRDKRRLGTEGVHVWASVQREATTRCTGVNRPPANLHTPTRSLLDDLEFPATKLLRFIRRVYLASIEKEKEGNSLPVSFNEKARGEEATSSSFLSLVSNSYLYIYILYINFPSKVRSC